MPKAKLKLDWCSHEAAKYACKNWHYSKSMPIAQCKLGVWEDDVFIGVVLFGQGCGNSTHGTAYGLARRFEVCELVRVALTKHKNPVSRIVSIAIRLMKKANPGIRLVISFADEKHFGHFGIIYQAGNWIYAGAHTGDGGWRIFGKSLHSRTVYSKGWYQGLTWLRENVDPNCEKIKPKKHRYLMPLDNELKERLKEIAQPYPKRGKQAMAGTTSTAAARHRPSRSNINPEAMIE